MILIHGIFASKEIMNPLFNHYKNTHHVISYDVRGHGKSDKPKNFNLNDYAEDLKQLIEKLNLKKPIVIGLSMGSYIALKTAEKYPELLSKIILLGLEEKVKFLLLTPLKTRILTLRKWERQFQKEHMLRIQPLSRFPSSTEETEVKLL